ncbi:hypothetical protein JRQ81_012991 [Phrynocephalus forsythii]|uniref:Uncharacterized protein n=1 Tax=Phrynocephalus forsythii TaxID=171643 RepID=A0A9Q0XY96_9SAUR|nr:hypothetical protein JRQ81_012991 [Phrynocephalus forsythii]
MVGVMAGSSGQEEQTPPHSHLRPSMTQRGSWREKPASPVSGWVSLRARGWQWEKDLLVAAGKPSATSATPTSGDTGAVKRNNIFMTSTLLQKNYDVKVTEKGIPPTNLQWDVLKPAILQPPQNPLSRLVEKTGAGNVLELEHKADVETILSGSVDSLWSARDNLLPPVQETKMELWIANIHVVPHNTGTRRSPLQHFLNNYGAETSRGQCQTRRIHRRCTLKILPLNPFYSKQESENGPSSYGT